jgi:hypothetical protein
MKFEQNEKRFKKIKNKYYSINRYIFYKTWLEVSAKNWVEFINVNIKNGARIQVTNTGLKSSENFAKKKKDGFYCVNKSLIKKCLKEYLKKGRCRNFGFSFVNITLDEFELELNKIKKS